MARIFIDVENNTDAVSILKTHCRSAKWDQKYRIWSVEDEEIQINPELLALKRYNAEQLEKKYSDIANIEIGLSHTYSDKRDMADRVYLDFINRSDLGFVADPTNGFRYDPSRETYYCSKEIAYLNTFNKRLVLRSQRRQEFTALDFGPSVATRGKGMLAKALNTDDDTTRLLFLAEAMVECAKEKAEGVEGAVSYGQIVKECDRLGVNAGLKSAYMSSFTFFGNRLAYSLNKFVSKSGIDAERNSREIFYRQKAMAFNSVAGLVDDKVNSQLFQLSSLMREGRLSPKRTIAETLAMQDENKSKRGYLSQDEYIARIGNIFEDFVKSMAIHSNIIALGGTPRLIWDQKIENFNHSLLNLVKSINGLHNISAEDRAILIKQTNVMANITVKSVKTLMRENDEIMLKNGNMPLNEKDYGKFEIRNLAYASSLSGMFKDLGYRTVKNVMNPFEQTPLRVSSNVNVLYLVMSKDERQNLPKELREQLKTDVYHGALCVEDTPENRETFAQFMPNEDNIKHMNEYADKLENEMMEHLKNAGVDVSKITEENKKAFFDGQVHKIGNVSFRFNTFSSEPMLEIGNKKFKLAIKNGEDFEKYLRDSLKANETVNALKMEKRQRIGNKIKAVFENGSMVSVNDTNLDFPFCKKMGVSVKELGGFVDQKGVFDEVSFFKEGTKTNTTVYLPMFSDSGRIVNTMAINDSGVQEFIKDAPMRGAFNVPPQRNYAGALSDNLPELLSKAKAIMICTDPLSAVAVAKHAPEGVVVVSAMTSSNIKYVAENLASKYPSAGIGVFADSSILQAGKTGTNTAVKLASQVKNILSASKPLTKVYDPPMDLQDLSEGKTTLYQASVSNPNLTREYIVNACIETISNQELQESVFNAEKKIIKESEEQLKVASSDVKRMLDNDTEIAKIKHEESSILKSVADKAIKVGESINETILTGQKTTTDKKEEALEEAYAFAKR